MNLRPRFCWHSNDLEWAVNILYKSQQRIIASGSGGTYNPLAAEGANLDLPAGRPLRPGRRATTTTRRPRSTRSPRRAWPPPATAARPSWSARPGEQGAKTAEVGYRIGTGRAPRIRSAILREGCGQYGMAWDVNYDLGVRGLDFRACSSSPAAARSPPQAARRRKPFL